MHTTTYLLVDGENTDLTLATILQNRPTPRTRPRWEKVRNFAEELWGAQKVEARFFIHVRQGDEPPHKFIHVLNILGYKVQLLRDNGTQGVVKEGIKRALLTLVDKPGNVLLLSHHSIYGDALRQLLGDPDRSVALIGFREFVSESFQEIPGLGFFDLEHDAQVFHPGVVLPRNNVASLNSFDPGSFMEQHSETQTRS